MTQALSVLLVDDRDDRTDEIARLLRAGGFVPVIARVADPNAAVEALPHGRFDVIICRSGHTDPCAQERLPHFVSSADPVPVIAVAEHIDLEVALQAIRFGLFDWVVAHHLEQRLALTVQRALVSAQALNREREARAELEHSERRYRRLVEAMRDGVVAIDHQGIITFANQAMASMLERPRDELMGMSLSDLVDGRDADVLAERLRSHFERGSTEPATYELRTATGSGQPLTIEITITPLRDGRDTLPGGLGIVRNVTLEHRRQEELRSIKIGLDNASDAVVVTNAEHRAIYTNPAFERLFGALEPGLDLTADTTGVITDPTSLPRLFERLETDGSLVTESEMRALDGHIFSALVRANRVTDPAGDVSGIVAVITDISALREREQRLSLVNRVNAMLHAGAAPDEIIAAATDELRALLRAELVLVILRPDPDERPDLLVIEHFSAEPEDLAAMEGALGRPARGIRLRLAPGEPPARLYQGEVVESRGIAEVARFLAGMPAVDRPDLDPVAIAIAHEHNIGYMYSAPLEVGGEIGGQVSVATRGDDPLSEEEQAFVCSFVEQMAIAIDKAHTERELVRVNQFLQGMIDNARVWFAVIDEHNRLIVWNRAAEEISGYACDEISDVDELMALLYPDERVREQVYAVVDRVFTGEITAGIFESTIRRRDGALRTIAWSLHRLTTPAPGGGAGLIVVGHDVTESHELQERLRRSQRMEAVGTLAGGVAHDFNNLLTAIAGYTELITSGVTDDSPARHYALQIADAVQRASRLTRQLLAFARRQPARPQVVDLNQVVRGMEELLSRLIRQNVELQLRLAPDLGATTIDPAQAEQVIMNLVVNARDAMPEGGALTTATTNATLTDEDMTGLFDARPGSYVTLTVSDTGVGMDEETQARIFEPFFTTKAETGNTGLGLATVYGIVRQNGGVISVYSEPGEGTSVRVYLPRADAPTPEDDQAAAHQPVGGRETLLVVEDAENLRTLMQAMLGQLGYTVLAAGSGAQALAMVDEHAGAIDLVIADVVMPTMSGTQLGERLLARYPGLRVLYVSGYPNERAIRAEANDPRLSFLQKPFSAGELARKVRAALDTDLSALS